jgi:uncharacterized protein
LSLYVDTSVLVAFYVPEPLSEEVERLLTAADDVVLSWLVEVEFASAISRKVRTGEMSAENGGLVLEELASHVAQGLYSRLPVGRSVFDRAVEYLSRFSLPLRTLEALHLAASQEADRTILTADLDLADAAKAIGCGSTFRSGSTGTAIRCGASRRTRRSRATSPPTRSAASSAAMVRNRP